MPVPLEPDVLNYFTIMPGETHLRKDAGVGGALEIRLAGPKCKMDGGFRGQQENSPMGQRINLTVQPILKFILAPKTGSVVLWKLRCQAVGQHSTVAECRS